MDERDAPSRVRTRPSWLLARAANRASRIVAERTAEVGATKTTYSMLAALEEFGATSQADLGRRLHLDRKDVSSVLGVLDRDGLVRRVTDPADARRQRVEITPSGLVMLERLEEAIDLAQDDLLAALPLRDRAELARILAAMTPRA